MCGYANRIFVSLYLYNINRSSTKEILDLKQIAIFQSDLRVGGIQKALVNILNEIDYSEYSVDLYLFDNEEFFKLPDHKGLNVYYRKKWPFLNRLMYFSWILPFAKSVHDKKYDIAIDFNSYRNECAAATIRTDAKKRVMWIHNDAEVKKRNEWKYKVLWHFFKSKLKYYDEFAAVSPGIVDGFRRISGIYDKRITPIPNHIDTAEIYAKAEASIDFKTNPEHYNLCTMGRLCHQKGFDILIGYLAEVIKCRPDMRLFILGDGPDKDKLQKQIDDLGLREHIKLLGNQQNPFPYLECMDGFALCSRYEGQGIVIWEAKALGLELFISDNLEKYNPGIDGYRDLVDAISKAERKDKVRDDLVGYNSEIGERLRKVLEL